LRRSMVFSHLIRRYCNRTGARLVLDYRDWIDASQLSVPARLFKRFERVVFTYPDAIWFVSEGCRSKAAEKHDLSRIFLQVAPNGAFAPDFTRICIQERSSLVRFLYAGDLGQQGRGIEELIAAIDACADLPCEFVLCGHNGEWLEQRETAPNVTFLGELSRSEVIRLMPSCDVGLIPLPDSDYYHRSFPTKLGEYVHNGLAILCTPVRDTADFVNAHNLGLAVPFHEWPNAIKRFVQDADLLERCKANSRALAPEMTWDRIYDRAFEELVSHFWGTNED
jgi:glycosyltransferase involved in cell wall biosynthesis